MNLRFGYLADCLALTDSQAPTFVHEIEIFYSMADVDYSLNRVLGIQL